MGTRCYVYIDKNSPYKGNTIAAHGSYRHWDGYPLGAGLDLLHFAATMRERKPYLDTAGIAVRLTAMHTLRGCSSTKVETEPDSANHANIGDTEYEYWIEVSDDKWRVHFRELNWTDDTWSPWSELTWARLEKDWLSYCRRAGERITTLDRTPSPLI